MTDKSMYLTGVRILNEVKNYSQLQSDEEKNAIVTAINALSRLYTDECISDIDFGCSEDESSHLEFMDVKHIGRIEAYNQSAENGVKKYISEKEMNEE